MIKHITNARARTHCTGKDAAGEKHPEKRMKAAYKAYGAFQCCRAGMVVGLLGLLVLAGSARRILSVAHTRVYTHTNTEERMLVELKQEMPGLKLSQYKVRDGGRDGHPCLALIRLTLYAWSVCLTHICMSMQHNTQNDRSGSSPCGKRTRPTPSTRPRPRASGDRG